MARPVAVAVAMVVAVSMQSAAVPRSALRNHLLRDKAFVFRFVEGCGQDASPSTATALMCLISQW